MGLRVLVTGANGFVGSSLCRELEQGGYEVIIASRSQCTQFGGLKKVYIGSIGGQTDWTLALNKVDIVIHLAARVHMMSDDLSDMLGRYITINKHGTLNLSQQAADLGVKRFIFLSTIKVNGEHTNEKAKFSPEDNFVPTDPYAVSKYEAEQGLLAIAETTGMEVVIIRPPLVYGPGVKANFASMMSWVRKGVPLPFGAIHNQRSLVALDNLVNFIIHCINHPKAANEIFLISDGEDISTTQLLRKVAKAFGKKPCLIPVPVSWMCFVATITGKTDVANRLFGSLQVDSSKARELLGWKPVITMDDQLKKTVEAY